MRNNVLNEEKEAQIQLSELKLFGILEGYNDDEINDVSVTLDDETANPKLELKNQNSVRRTKVEQHCLDTGKRFTELESVLGLEEFRSERYYWVVEVGMDWNWSLGVATETAERSGMVELTPENGASRKQLYSRHPQHQTCPREAEYLSQLCPQRLYPHLHCRQIRGETFSFLQDQPC